MRPYPNELLDSALHSLREVLIPAISDDWALYVAKCLDKLLVDVQVRITNDLSHLARDTAEVAELFDRLRLLANAAPQSALNAALEEALAVATVEPAIAVEQADGLYERAVAADDAARTQLAGLVDVLYAIERGERAGSVEAAEAAHALVREHLKRQLARDVALTAPMFMAFGDPQRVSR